MKIIHTADVHLGSKMEAKLPKDKSDQRKTELRTTFSRLIAFAKESDSKVVLLSGDIFDMDNPYKKDKDFFYSVIRNNPEIDFLYLRGNHDSSAVYDDNSLKNLKTFSKRWSCYEYGDVNIWGIEMDEENAESLYSTLITKPDKKNIVMLHGQISDSVGNGLINISRLKFKNIDYLALGHVHKFQTGKIDDRGVYAYCGCLEPRGFDEIGEKGFIQLDTDDISQFRFTPFSTRAIYEVDVDVTGAKDIYEVISYIKKQVTLDQKDMYRINLVGTLPFEMGGIAKDVESMMGSNCYFLSVKDKTNKPVDFSSFEKEKSLAGEFVRQVRASSNLSAEEKDAIVALGINAIQGKELE